MAPSFVWARRASPFQHTAHDLRGVYVFVGDGLEVLSRRMSDHVQSAYLMRLGRDTVCIDARLLLFVALAQAWLPPETRHLDDAHPLETISEELKRTET